MVGKSGTEFKELELSYVAGGIQISTIILENILAFS